MAHQRTGQHLPDKPGKPGNEAQHIKLLNTVLSATTEFVYLIDAQGKYRFVSEKGASVLGMTQSDMLGKTWQELGLPAEFMQPFEVHRRKVMSTGQGVTEETPFPVAIGMRWFEFVANPIVNEHGDIESVVVASKDITDRKQGEEAIHWLAFIVESSDEAIYSKTLEGVITSWNKSAEKLYGYAASEALGQSALLIFPPGHAKDYLEIMERIKVGEGIDHLETTRLRKDGTCVEVLITISPLRGFGGRIIGASTIAHDISEKKRVREELITHSRQLERSNADLERLYQRVQEANRLKSEFLANMSHELRTPLNAIIGFTEMMYDGETGEVSAVQREYLGDVLSSSRHLLQLINDVLDLAKMEAGKMTFSPEKIDLERVVGEVRDILRLLMNKKRIHFGTEIDTKLDGVVIDPAKFKQVLYNYLSNALKFTPDEGQVTVRIKPEGEDTFLLEVEDSGIGIPPEDVGRLFVEFQQLDAGMTKKHQGTGLGLALTRHIVEA